MAFSRKPNGKAKGHRRSEFDPVQLKRGMEVEMEHTRDHALAEEIAADHLTEDPDYYRNLAQVHLDGADTTTGNWLIPVGVAAAAGLALWWLWKR